MYPILNLPRPSLSQGPISNFVTDLIEQKFTEQAKAAVIKYSIISGSVGLIVGLALGFLLTPKK